MRSITSASATSNTMSSNYLNQSQTIPLLTGVSTTQQTKLDWETLRKQARQLENEIDSKLVAFSKLCTNYTAASPSYSNRSNLPSPGPSSSPIPQQNAASSTSSSDLLFMTLSNEIEESVKRLTNINTKMSESLNNNEASVNSNATVHTLQRHRDILRDYSIEYEKTKRNIISFKEREKLLSNRSVTSVNETNLNNRRSDSASNNNSTSLYMKEHDHLKSSHLLIDQQIELAELTKENLQSQRQALRYIQQRMNTIAHKFPLINGLVQRIKFKKRKDSFILAGVISFCIIILLLYIF